MSLLLTLPIFSKALGSVDSWIGFWGSYLGALIGAGIVYFVTNKQVTAQRDIQIEAIKNEHDNALKRDMKQFHFRTQIDKIEEFNDLIEGLIDSLHIFSKEYLDHIRYKQRLLIIKSLNSSIDKEKENCYNEKIEKITFDSRYQVDSIDKVFFKMARLSLYVEDTSAHVVKIKGHVDNFIKEIEKGYKDEDPDEHVVSRNYEEFIKLIFLLQTDVLEPKLKEKIEEMTGQSNRD